MKAYLLRRCLLVIPTFLGISVITFAILQLSPGNPVYLKLVQIQATGLGESVNQQVIDELEAQYGFDRPLPERYVKWVWDMARLDFGKSFKDHRPVTTRIAEALPVTLQLNFISLLIIYAVSIPIGIFSATHAGTRRDGAITVTLFLLYSLPSFWVAMLLMYFVGGGGGSGALQALCERAFNAIGAGDAAWATWLLENVLHFRWFPIFGFSTPGSDDWPFHRWLLDRLWHFCLPVFCLSYTAFASLSRYARSGMIETIRQDYIRTAHAYGFSERTVIYRYALRNSLIPIITLLGNFLPAMVAGSVIIESIFSIPGMGKLFYDSILGRDYPVVMGVFTITALLTMVGLILSDLLYALVDPRIRFE